MNAAAMLLLLATYREDVGSDRLDAHRAEIAAAVQDQSARAPGPVPAAAWAALLLTVANHESHFSIRISDGQCKPHECDRGRARGMWQLHRNALNAADWAAQDGDVRLQVRLASDALKRAYWTCARSGVPWLQGTLNAFAGKRCDATWAGLGERMATFRRLAR